MLESINNEIRDQLENSIRLNIFHLLPEISLDLRGHHVIVDLNAFLNTVTIVRFIQHL